MSWPPTHTPDPTRSHPRRNASAQRPYVFASPRASHRLTRRRPAMHVRARIGTSAPSDALRPQPSHHIFAASHSRNTRERYAALYLLRNPGLLAYASETWRMIQIILRRRRKGRGGEKSTHMCKKRRMTSQTTFRSTRDYLHFTNAVLHGTQSKRPGKSSTFHHIQICAYR